MQSGSYLGVVRRWWFTLLAATAVGAMAGWLVAGALPDTYRSESRILVGPINADFDTIRAAAELTRTYADVATSSEVLSAAISSSGIAATTEVLRDALQVIPNEQTRIITVSVDLPTADEATRAAGGVAQALVAYTAAGAERPEGELRIIDGATPAVSAAPGRTALVVVLAALGALLGALLLVLLIEALDTTLRDAGQIRRIAGNSYAGELPIGRTSGSHVMGGFAEPAYVEALGDLRGTTRRPMRSVLVLSAGAADAALSVAEGLGDAAAALGLNAVLYWTEPPWQDRPIGTRPGGASPQDAATSAIVRDPGAAAALRDELLRSADLLVVVGGQALETYSAPMWARAVDRSIIVARLGAARRDRLQSSIHRLLSVPGASVTVFAGTRRGRSKRRAPSRNAQPSGERMPARAPASATPAPFESRGVTEGQTAFVEPAAGSPRGDRRPRARRGDSLPGTIGREAS